ncbi:hypothetical protein E2C01_000528 [Portunus trituberculatus]|uniref:Uncharacterized protein n=1 Tax=Portunus trituberculatus TaxID=210409 RepID=A0A5B7CEK4_PORTR|nr:hypothetical protein [Portunus trituberculatus]
MNQVVGIPGGLQECPLGHASRCGVVLNCVVDLDIMLKILRQEKLCRIICNVSAKFRANPSSHSPVRSCSSGALNHNNKGSLKHATPPQGRP